MLLDAMRHCHIGFANVTTLQFLTHFYYSYTFVKDPYLEDNKKNDNGPFGYQFSIKIYFD